MHRMLTFAFVFLIGCASAHNSGRPESISKPLIEPRLTSPLYFGDGNQAPATFDVLIQNTAKVPILVRRIELDSPGMVMYTLEKTIRTYAETIAPGETKTFTISAMATTQTSLPREPLAVRVIAQFESGDHSWREMTLTR